MNRTYENSANTLIHVQRLINALPLAPKVGGPMLYAGAYTVMMDRRSASKNVLKTKLYGIGSVNPISHGLSNQIYVNEDLVMGAPKRTSMR